MSESLGMGNNHGGARPGAGRPKGSKNEAPLPVPEDYDPFDPDATPIDSSAPRTNYAVARARVEATKALSAELSLRVRLGQYVERDKVRSASATIFADFAQAMRSLQDEMERKLDLAPEVTEAIGQYVDRYLDQLADSLEMLGGTKDV